MDLINKVLVGSAMGLSAFILYRVFTVQLMPQPPEYKPFLGYATIVDYSRGVPGVPMKNTAEQGTIHQVDENLYYYLP